MTAKLQEPGGICRLLRWCCHPSPRQESRGESHCKTGQVNEPTHQPSKANLRENGSSAVRVLRGGHFKPHHPSRDILIPPGPSDRSGREQGPTNGSGADETGSGKLADCRRQVKSVILPYVTLRSCIFCLSRQFLPGPRRVSALS